MKQFTESDRYEYPLTPDSVVVDAGCYEGNWSNLISEKYGCHIIALEPVPEFFEQCHRKLAKWPKVRLWNYALGDHTDTTYLRVKGDQSGQWCDGNSKAECGTVTPATVLVHAEALGANVVDLLKLNIEGGEFPVLEFILNARLATRFRHIQVQMHSVVPDYQRRHDEIFARLSETHEHVYHEPWCWDGFSLRT